MGVPFTTKESNEAKDMLHTMGLTSRCTFRSEEDATAIRFMKNAGGILIAKTNIPELNLWTESRNNIKIPGSEYSYRLWRFWMTQENFDFKINITNGKYRANALTEISKFLTGRSDLTLAAILKLIDEDIFPREDAEWAMNVTTNMKQYLMDKLKHNGILIYPSSPFQTGYHYTAYLRPFNFGYWCLFNVLKLPVCQVPLGVGKNGLPIGVQVVAAPYNDHLCLAVARELEKVFGGWVSPS